MSENQKIRIGKRIREIRDSKKLTQEEFAINTGVKKDHIAKVEIGTLNPNPVLLQNLHVKYDYNLNWIITGSGKKKIEGDINIIEEEQEENNTSCKYCKEKNKLIKQLEEEKNKAWDQVEFLQELITGDKKSNAS